MFSGNSLSFGRYDHAAFLTFFAYAAGSVIVPVSLVELAGDLGFSLEDGGLTAGGALHFARTVAMVVAMMIVGFIAGQWGTRRTLGYSVLLMTMGVFLCALAPSYAVLFLALLLAGLGEGVIEGLATPFVQNLHPQEPGRYVNLTHAFWSIGVLVTVLSAGWLLDLGISWRVIVALVAVVGGVAGLMILWPASSQNPYPEVGTGVPWRTTFARALKILRLPRFWLYYAAMFLAGGGEFCLTFWSASHIQLHFAGSPFAGGFGVALFAFAMVIGRVACGVWVEQRNLTKAILIAAVFGTVVTLGLPSAGSLPVFYALLFAAGLATAPFWPSIQSDAADRMPQMDGTMLLILLSCAGVPGSGVFAFLMGYLGSFSGSLSNTFYLVPFAYAGIFLLISLTRRLPSLAPCNDEPN